MTPSGSGVYCEGIEIIENQHDTESQYTFNYGTLRNVKYNFSSLDSFDAVEQELIKKYGTTDYSSDTGREFPNIEEYPDMPDCSVPITSYYQDKGSNAFDAHLLKYSHRFIELDDGRGIFIEHFVWVRDFLANGTLVSAWEWHRLQYTVYEADAVTYIIKSALEEQ